MYGTADETALATWWSDLSPEQRSAAIKRPPTDPMPQWMVRTLTDAGVTGIVAQAVAPPHIVQPWFAMPDEVAEFIASRHDVTMKIVHTGSLPR